ncbi:PREDICTED: adenylate cyclase type 10-like [Vollenhovia emeryi]|uniref:adenylate cyclase type 10-like n=1 Tax=Vollenhovia emeryi TaxID=411798 RepID=UPI0005F54D2B|nr:PREDICTED: adenylate cyclase type 10-like [Vollenhovia emeryi]
MTIVKRKKTSDYNERCDEARNIRFTEIVQLADRSSRARLEQHTKIFASMCPDEILDHYDNYETREYDTTLMLGDISGFTDLTEKYTKTGVGGPSKLSETLNSYIGAMVQEILSHDGDVVKFSGDAFIVMWKLQEGMLMRDIATEAIQTACIIQKHFGTYNTDVGVTLRGFVASLMQYSKILNSNVLESRTSSNLQVKDRKHSLFYFYNTIQLYHIFEEYCTIDCKVFHSTIAPQVNLIIFLIVKLAIASGITYFTSIGDPETMSYYVITGKPVWDVKFAEGLCRGGDILVAPSSWQWANPNEYVCEKLPDGIHTLIIACSAMWHHSRAHDIHNGTEINNRNAENNRNFFDLPRDANNANLVNWIGDTQTEHDFEQVDYSLRPKVIRAAKERLKDSLRSYMLRPVIRSVEMDEPLEHLTEMRQVVILFINVITTVMDNKGLISLVSAAYKLVCGIVCEMHGCVNKTSLFDKDLIFLCIFGLRGDKHVLESQIGLRCASKVRQSLLAMKNVKSVTIAVTTGMTYCGVIGHILRREYTVIGMSVNKAARLMVAYNNKVICDRESFLRSRLEARHFILQEPRHLKGITKVGPVYEFQEHIKFIAPELTRRKYPLLGREAEIKIFRQMLSNLTAHLTMDETTQQCEYNMLIIKGEPRIGKTRLLDEISQNIPTGVSRNYISLVMNDVKVSYSLIHLIFSMPLGFNVATTPRDREEILMSRLEGVCEPEFLCALNQLFNVHFMMSSSYTALSRKQKRKMLRKFLLKLMKSCFRELWVVIIDNAQYSDEDSMKLFRTITNQSTVLFILSLGRKLNGEYEMDPSVLEKARIIELGRIDKWYHAALACQILDASGIPPELERLIQERSFGNPGWIESYLLSLTQSGSLVIVHISKLIAEEMGYVLPPIYMLKRFASEETFLNDGNNEEERRSDKWKMYRASYRNGQISMMRPHAVHKAGTPIYDEETIAVCKFTQGFVPEEGDTEVTMDVMILKIFDSLTPLDQLLLKCASVLGEIINRSMLQYLMEDKSTREIGLAVKKLFEIRIFGCARGDFTMSGRPLVFYRNIRKFNLEAETECECVDLMIPEELTDLPRYASCGLMYFKMSMFRETTYRSLTENQKMELHSKALKYLRQHTKRCMTCGEIQFTRLLGKTPTQETRRRRLTVDITEMHQIEESTYNFKEETENDTQPETERTPICLNIFRSVRKSTKTFSNVDFANCQCHLILITVYAQILEHCQGIGKQDMIVTAILEFVEICLASNNVPQARRLLSDAEALLLQMLETNEEKSIVLLYLIANIQTFQGRCHLESGLLSEASKKLNDAMSSLGYNFPRRKFTIDSKLIIQLELLRWRLACPKRWKIDDELTTNYVEQLANCLAQMFNVFRGMKKMKKHARLAAIWGLNAALDASNDFLMLCTSLTHMMIIAHVYQTKSIVPYLERHALNICAKKGDLLEFQELKAIAELYAGVFFSRWLRSEISKAIRIGFITMRMAQTLDSVNLKLLILPRLVHLLMISCRHSEVVTLLRELEFASRNNLDKSGRTWYYAMCADALLDTGLTVLSFQNCDEYYLQEGETIISVHDPEAERRYFTSMWLWCVRMQQWEATKVWSNRNVTAESMVDEHKVAATITALKKIEGLLILYVKEVTNRNINALNTLTEIKYEFKHVGSMIKIVKIAVPRYMLMKAYYYMIQSRKSAAISMLRKAKKLAIKVDNRMIYAWANHCQQAWLGAISTIHEDLWKEKTMKVHNGWDEVNANDSTMIPFTLPLPKYML